MELVVLVFQTASPDRPYSTAAVAVVAATQLLVLAEMEAAEMVVLQ